MIEFFCCDALHVDFRVLVDAAVAACVSCCCWLPVAVGEVACKSVCLFESVNYVALWIFECYASGCVRLLSSLIHFHLSFAVVACSDSANLSLIHRVLSALACLLIAL